MTVACAVAVAGVTRRAAEILPWARLVSSGNASIPTSTRTSLAVRAASLLTINNSTVVSCLAAPSALAALSSVRAARDTFATALAHIATTGTVTPLASWTTLVSSTALSTDRATSSTVAKSVSAWARLPLYNSSQQPANHLSIVNGIFRRDGLPDVGCQLPVCITIGREDSRRSEIRCIISSYEDLHASQEKDRNESEQHLQLRVTGRRRRF